MASAANDQDGRDRDIDDSQAPLIEHLAELRTRLVNALIALAVAMIFCFFFAREVYDVLTAPLCQELATRGKECALIFTAIHEQFFTDLRMSLFGGLFLAFPFVANQLWRFVAPGLYQDEKSAFWPFLVATPVLFAAGASLVYFLVMPMAFGFFLDYGSRDLDPAAGPPPITLEMVVDGAVDRSMAEAAGVEGAAPPDRTVVEISVRAAVDAVREVLAANGVATEIAGAQAPADDASANIQFLGKVNEYLSIVMTFIFAFGLSFQLPVLLTLLGRAGIASADGLARGRKYAVVGIAAAAAMLTPPDPFSQLGLGLPIYLLYEISIILVRGVEKKRSDRLREEGVID